MSAKILAPDSVIEWTEYDQFEEVEHLTEGGCATIYTATWKDGCYDKWNSKRQILERSGRQKIVLKRLNNSNNKNKNNNSNDNNNNNDNNEDGDKDNNNMMVRNLYDDIDDNECINSYL
ncbi:hypothetical protein Glove_79g101 [Diversispora epigaea]|uniref:Protein kinase domain-containing protein n=1 Tax=Diversispora epigaea TaxID=1348612 RepID=A0A397J8E2_9GLOM|nr:hypothetical protein Glove_79g101 [Diversispora epigaea]